LVVTLPGYRMLRDVVDTGKGVLWEREMLVAPRLDGGRVSLSVTCVTETWYPVFVDGRDLAIKDRTDQMLGCRRRGMR
jgi:hypothetical protein